MGTKKSRRPGWYLPGRFLRAMVAARVANMRHGERTDLEPSANLPKVSQREAAEKLNVSERSLRNAVQVVDHGVPNWCRRWSGATLPYLRRRSWLVLPPRPLAGLAAITAPPASTKGRLRLVRSALPGFPSSPPVMASADFSPLHGRVATSLVHFHPASTGDRASRDSRRDLPG